MKNQEKSWIENKEIHYIKILVQDKRVANDYCKSIIIINLKLYIIYIEAKFYPISA